MNIKNNKSYQNNHALIEKAVLDLLDESPKQDISISDICRKAQINRSTFYRHFIDIDDLYFELSKDLQLPCYEAIKNVPNEKKLETFVSSFLTVVEKNRNFFSFYFTSSHSRFNNASFQAYWQKAIVPVFQRSGVVDKTSMKYYYMYFVGGFVSILMNWVKDGYKEKKEKIEEIILRCFKISHKEL